MAEDGAYIQGPRWPVQMWNLDDLALRERLGLEVRYLGDNEHEGFVDRNLGYNRLWVLAIHKRPSDVLAMSARCTRIRQRPSKDWDSTLM